MVSRVLALLLMPLANRANLPLLSLGVFATCLLARHSPFLLFALLPAGRTMYQFKFQIPPYYTLLVRSLSVLEGIALASDPNYKVGVLLFFFVVS